MIQFQLQFSAAYMHLKNANTEDGKLNFVKFTLTKFAHTLHKCLHGIKSNSRGFNSSCVFVLHEFKGRNKTIFQHVQTYLYMY
jgi:hypothetical protein